MLSEILLGGGTAIVSGVMGFFISKKITSANFDIYVDQATAKAKAIENEAQTLLDRSRLKAKEIELDAQKLFDSAKERARADFSQREDKITQNEKEFARYRSEEEHKIQTQLYKINAQKINLERTEKSLQSLKVKYGKSINNVLHTLEHCAGLTQEEAKTELFNKIEGLSVLKPDGAFYLFVNIKEVSNDSLSFAKELLESKGVAVVPGVGFGSEGYFRFSFATGIATIREGIKRIDEFTQELKAK